MCRLLCVKSAADFEITRHLEQLAKISGESKEYQGHGWGCAWVENGVWHYYHHIDPIWQHDLEGFPKTNLLLAHARSAFRDEGIAIENNMPFHDERHAFIFNGELQGVRIKEQGRIGAEKVFNYIKRFDKGNMLTAMQRAIGVINKKTRYVRAMNLIVADTKNAWIASGFSEDPDYFQMHKRESKDMRIVSSQPYADETNWQIIANGAIETV